MINDGKKWHYLAVKTFPALFKGITSNHQRTFSCLNCLRSLRTKNKLKKHVKIMIIAIQKCLRNI